MLYTPLPKKHEIPLVSNIFGIRKLSKTSQKSSFFEIPPNTGHEKTYPPVWENLAGGVRGLACLNRSPAQI